MGLGVENEPGSWSLHPLPLQHPPNNGCVSCAVLCKVSRARNWHENTHATRTPCLNGPYVRKCSTAPRVIIGTICSIRRGARLLLPLDLFFLSFFFFFFLSWARTTRHRAVIRRQLSTAYLILTPWHLDSLSPSNIACLWDTKRRSTQEI